jgi:flagellar motility protein MotE (MotC chaperone)
MTLATMLLASGLIRLAADAGALIAHAEGNTSQTAATTEPMTCPNEEELTALLAAISEREGRVAEREDQITDRTQAIQVAEARLTDRIAALDEAQAALAATLSVAETAASDDLTRLTTVYENMKPKDAAALFSEMPPEFASGFLARMRPEAAAAIMAGLDPATAYSFSVMIAGRNANVPTQ